MLNGTNELPENEDFPTVKGWKISDATQQRKEKTSFIKTADSWEPRNVKWNKLEKTNNLINFSSSLIQVKLKYFDRKKTLMKFSF